MDYKIKKISEVNIDLLNNFYRAAFPLRYKNLIKNWKWYYRIGYNNHEPLVLEYKSKIVSMAGLIPAKLNFQKKLIDAIWFTDFLTLKEFRKKGFGSILTKEWMKICPTQITFCNDESLKLFKKFKWLCNNDTYRSIKLVKFNKLIPIIKNLNIDIKSNFFKSFLKKNKINEKLIKPTNITNDTLLKLCRIEENKSKDSKFLSIIRDEKWFKWRLVECPYNSDVYQFIDDLDIIVCHIFKFKNLKRINILYSYIHDKKKTNVFNLIFNWSSNNDIDFIWCLNNNNNNHKLFKETLVNNFFFKKKINFAGWSEDETIRSCLGKGLSNSQGLDSDIDSILFQNQ